MSDDEHSSGNCYSLVYIPFANETVRIICPFLIRLFGDFHLFARLVGWLVG
jgi:hypothetical protein